jgi:uncharacterized repeat protein (TIGR01451 family)
MRIASLFFSFFSSVKCAPKVVRWQQAALAIALTCFAAPGVFAAGTRAGTAIPNSATLNYSVAGRPAAPLIAAAPVVIVAEVINVVLTWQDGSPVPVNSPDAGKALTFMLTNAGNGDETFRLVRNNLIAGDQFDPANAPSAIYLENGARAGFQPSGPDADTVYTPGLNDPRLGADTSRAIYVISSIPSAQATGALGHLSLNASSTTVGAPGAPPGTTLAGLGQGGVDAMVGGSRAQATAQGSYIVSGISLNLAKTIAAVRDASGGSLVMPGSVPTYRVVLSLTGAGLAENLSFDDPLPAGTTYVPDSINVDGVSRSDAADADNAGFAAGAVSARFGNTPAPATRVIEFKATVD